jgi:hypothetical protein
VRLFDYSKNAEDKRPDVFVQLEKTRAARHINWTQDELIAITRLLLTEGYGEAASRFLYTLYLQGEMKPGSKLRAQVLYQLFEILSDAGNERLSLTRGDLKFYQDIATADPHPGMVGGILSLILSDTDPKYEFAAEEERAVSYFNRAAAYRIFTAYKQENPTSPELAQMYLDIVRLYTGTKNLDVASETLAEFEKRYTDAPEFPEVALKLTLRPKSTMQSARCTHAFWITWASTASRARRSFNVLVRTIRIKRHKPSTLFQNQRQSSLRQSPIPRSQMKEPTTRRPRPKIPIALILRFQTTSHRPATKTIERARLTTRQSCSVTLRRWRRTIGPATFWRSMRVRLRNIPVKRLCTNSCCNGSVKPTWWMSSCASTRKRCARFLQPLGATVSRDGMYAGSELKNSRLFRAI